MSPGADSAPDEELVANVRKSVRTATDVLNHLRRSLEQGGFARSTASYKTMVSTLVGQRLWSQEVGDEEIDAAFKELSVLAARIHGILTPYAQMMEQLGALDSLSLDEVELVPSGDLVGDGEVNELDDEARQVLIILQEAGKPISFTRLRSTSGLSRSRLDQLLGGLLDAGLVLESRPGGRRMVGLA